MPGGVSYGTTEVLQEVILKEASLFLGTLFQAVSHNLFLEIRAVPANLLARERCFFRLRQLQRHGFGQAVPAQSISVPLQGITTSMAEFRRGLLRSMLAGLGQPVTGRKDGSC